MAFQSTTLSSDLAAEVEEEAVVEEAVDWDREAEVAAEEAVD